MNCCLIAAFLIAQGFATLRRWGMFWGLVEVPEGETADTLFSRMRDTLTSKRFRPVIIALAALEIVAVGIWLYRDHQQHIAEYIDVEWSRLQGEEVIYVGMCSPTGERRERVALAKGSSST